MCQQNLFKINFDVDHKNYYDHFAIFLGFGFMY
jgi:hypothetical protein